MQHIARGAACGSRKDKQSARKGRRELQANTVPCHQNSPDQTPEPGWREKIARIWTSSDMEIICSYFPHFILQFMHKAYVKLPVRVISEPSSVSYFAEHQPLGLDNGSFYSSNFSPLGSQGRGELILRSDLPLSIGCGVVQNSLFNLLPPFLGCKSSPCPCLWKDKLICSSWLA